MSASYTIAALVADLSADQVLLIAIAAVAGGYFASLRLHPFSKCPRCKGKGVHRGSVYNFATRPCTKCKGRGVRARLGRRVFLSDKR